MVAAVDIRKQSAVYPSELKNGDLLKMIDGEWRLVLSVMTPMFGQRTRVLVRSIPKKGHIMFERTYSVNGLELVTIQRPRNRPKR